MSGRFAVTTLLVFATVAFCEVKGQQSLRCWCEVFNTRKTPIPTTVTYRMAMYEIEDDSLTSTDCQQFSIECMDKCTNKLQEEFQATQLGTRHDPRFQLGKMLCKRAGVGIPATSPRQTFLQTKVPGCEDAGIFNFIKLGDLCCYKCLNEQNVVEITYNPDCDPYKYPAGRCDL